MSIDLCLVFMECGVGKASFPFHIPERFYPILAGICVEKYALNGAEAAFISYLKMYAKCDMDTVLG